MNMYTQPRLIATNHTDSDLAALASHLADQISSLAAKGIAIHTITILPRQADWIATIIHQQPAANRQPTAQRRPGTPGDGYIKLVDVAERTYYSLEHARELCQKHRIPLYRGPGSGRPHYVTVADAQRLVAETCPGVSIRLDDITHTIQLQAA